MSVVHFSTQVTGGAGAFALSIHTTMQELNVNSVLISREISNAENCIAIKPLSKFKTSLKSRWLALKVKCGLVDSKYATFGAEKSPVEFVDLQEALIELHPTAFVFYWVSYFVNFKCMFDLRQAYPETPFIFVCLDEVFLTGGCHYSWGCDGYKNRCIDCPSTTLSHGKKKIEDEHRSRANVIQAINPLVLYPTTRLEKMGKESSVLQNMRSVVIPLGAVSTREKKEVAKTRDKKKLTLLVRSSSEYRKGCDLFIDAIKSISAKLPNIRSLLEVISIGDNTLSDAEIDEWVDHFHYGFVDRENLLTIYGKTDVLIVTSREDSGPIMINECIALDKFVITTPVGVAEDLIDNNKSGLIISDFSSEAVENALYDLVESKGSELATKYNGSCSDSFFLTFEGYIQIMLKKIQNVTIKYDEL